MGDFRYSVDVRMHFDPNRDIQRNKYARWDRTRNRGAFRGNWVELADQNTTAGGRQMVAVPDHAINLRRLRIEGVRGAPIITQVAIQYGTDTQVVPLNVRLARGAGEVIDVNRGRAITGIVVYTDAGSTGTYSIYGS